MKSSFFFICIIVSFILFYFAPNYNDTFYNVLCFLVFAIQSYFVLRDDIRNEGILNVNVLFIFSFFLVSYAFPIFILRTAQNLREGVDAIIDFSVSCKCSALCTLASSCYFFAYKRSYKNLFDFSSVVKSNQWELINLFYYILFLVMLYQTLVFMRTYSDVSIDTGIWNALYLASLPLSLIYNCNRKHVRNIKQYVSANFGVLTTALLLMSLFFIIGDRGLVIIAGITLVAVYSVMVKRIRPVLFVLGIIVGSLLMFVVRETRTSEASLRSGDNTAFVNSANDALSGAGVLTIFSDLTNIHRELYIGYDYYEHVGLIEPRQWLIVPFYPLPVVPNMMSQAMFGKSMNEIKPGVILNDYVAYTGHGHFGIHCVIDIFMRWGIVGVFIFFYLWGYIVKSLAVTKSKNYIGMALYIILLASAIRIPRAPILDMLRVFAYVIFLAWAASVFVRTRRIG